MSCDFTRKPRELTFSAIASSLGSEESGRASSTATSFLIRRSARLVGKYITAASLEARPAIVNPVSTLLERQESLYM